MTLLLLCNVLSAGETYLKTYSIPNQTITRVNTVQRRNSNYLLALEGYHRLTGEFFSRLQATDLDGNLTEGFESVFIGEPNTLSSGLIANDISYSILTPLMDEFQPQDFRFRWMYGSEDSQTIDEDGYYSMPDSVQSIVEFPSAMGRYIDSFWGTSIALVTGRGIVNNLYQSFLIRAGIFISDSNPSPHICFIPDLVHISGVTRINDRYLIIGQGANWSGKLILTDLEGNQFWQTTFTDGADASHAPYFTTPLMDDRWGSTGYDGGVRYISYQGKDRILHIDRYETTTLTHIFSEQLDAFANAVPILMNGSSIVFAYPKSGYQLVRCIDESGNTLWTRRLPGIGSFGKRAMAIHPNPGLPSCSIVVSGRTAEGFYLARIDAATGRLDHDESVSPPQPDFIVYPNPIRTSASLLIDLPNPGTAQVSVYNPKGQFIKTIATAYLAKGRHRLDFAPVNAAGKPLPAGVYLLRLKTADGSIDKKILVP